MHDGKVVDFDTPEKIFARDDLGEMVSSHRLCVRISKQMGLKNADGTYPVTLESTAALFHQHKAMLTWTQELRSK